MAVGSFDHVNIRKGAGWDLLTAAYFWKLPLKERVGLIMDKKIEFIRDGRLIPVTEALRKTKPVDDAGPASG